ncbi:Ldh family oxidoreductase [Mycolicibacterium sp. XJ2546]
MSNYSACVLIEAASVIFAAAGMTNDAARQVAEALVEADARGICSHGLMLVPMYVNRLCAGSVTTNTEAEIVVDRGAIAVLDARHAVGVCTADQSMSLAIKKAKVFGIGAVTTRHAFHFGGGFRYAQQAVDANCIGIASANTRALMPAPGGATAVVGNNPIAVGVPGDDPLMVDMALSEAALGKIRLAASEGRDIPLTWATDKDGSPTTSPTAALTGLLLPIGGPKGYGLALIVDVLCGVLSGGAFGPAVKGLYANTEIPNDCAHFFMAIDPAVFGDLDSFRQRTLALTQHIRASTPRPGIDAVMLPGQRESENASRARIHGISVAQSVLTGLRQAAEQLGVTLPEELRR